MEIRGTDTLAFAKNADLSAVSIQNVEVIDMKAIAPSDVTISALTAGLTTVSGTSGAK